MRKTKLQNMKKIILAFLITVTAFSVNAQKNNNVKFSLGAELGVPTGNLNTLYSVAIGVTAQADIKIDKDVALTFNTGVIQYVGKKIRNTDFKYRSETLIPLLVGIKYYFTPMVYGSGQLGTSISTAQNGGSTFTYIPGVGYKFDEKLDLLVKYTGYSGDGGAFGVRLGYTF